MQIVFILNELFFLFHLFLNETYFFQPSYATYKNHIFSKSLFFFVVHMKSLEVERKFLYYALTLTKFPALPWYRSLHTDSLVNNLKKLLLLNEYIHRQTHVKVQQSQIFLFMILETNDPSSWMQEKFWQKKY